MSAEGSAQAAAPTEEIPKVDEATTTTAGAPTASSETTAPASEKVDEPVSAEQPVAVAPKEEEPTKAAEGPAKKPTEDAAPVGDVVMKDADEAAPAPVTEEPASKPEDHQAAEAAPNAEGDTVAGSSTTPAKTVARRKSTGPAGGKGKTLSKKASKARILHLDAKPGDHFFIKLKGYPPWPCIICDEEMLPLSLIKSRPVTAARADGTYREDYADGGKRAADRTFPVMYLSTNEFGWVANADLVDLEPDKVLDLINSKMRKDLVDAHQLAAQHNSLEHYKGLLQQFAEDQAAHQQALEAKAQATPAKKSRKSKGADVDEDVEMADASEEPAKEKKTKKRKAEDDTATPQRSDSVKKPKIKLTNNSTPKTANGVPTPKSGKVKDDSKPAKPKAKKSKDTEEKKSEPQAPKEPELSPEERHQRKEKEVLFLRHKLQKGLLARDQEPKEEEMKMMSEYITKLEGLPDLEVSIIRVTKINKVLKAILKLENIPKEDEFQFKPRSTALLEKWNKILAVDGAPAAAAPTNGVNGTSSKSAEKKEEPKATNGVKENGETDAPKVEEKSAPIETAKDQPAADKPVAEEPVKAPEATEATAAA